YTQAEIALLDFAVQVAKKLANQIDPSLWNRIRQYYSESQIVEAVMTLTIFTSLSDFGNALNVSLEPVFESMSRILPHGSYGETGEDNTIEKHYTLKLVEAN
ncbi:MAG: hypothetical protein ACR2PH_13115, partial [Desulfobulbia bacterium]